MHTCILSHGLKRSWHLCPKRVNAGNKNTPSMHYPRRRSVTTSMVGFKKKGNIRKNLTQNGKPQRYSWGRPQRQAALHELLLNSTLASATLGELASRRKCGSIYRTVFNCYGSHCRRLNVSSFWPSHCRSEIGSQSPPFTPLWLSG